MNDKKWKFTEPAPDELPAHVKERRGMFFLLIAGSVLMAGGLIFAWKIGAFDLDYFYGISPEKTVDYYRIRREFSQYSIFFHAPWIAGAYMVRTAVNYLIRHRHK